MPWIRKLGRNTIVLLCIIFILIFPTPVCLGQGDIKVYVDGEQVGFPDQKPYINKDSRTMVPVRFVSEALGAAVAWEEANKTVKIEHKGNAIELTIGSDKAKKGTEAVLLDTRADIVNNRTMVPLRFVSECLGSLVEWDAYMRAVYITTLEKPITPFVGTPMDENTFPVEGGNEIIYGSDRPGAQYMYVTVDQLPVRFGQSILYSLGINEEVISVRQYVPNRSALHMGILQDGVLIAGRTAGVFKTNPFTAEYSLHNQCDIALGYPRVVLERINAFLFSTINDGKLVLLLVKNPYYQGEWRP